MEINILFVTYDSAGGHETLSHAGDFLLLDAPKSFGSAVRTIEMYPRLEHTGPPRKTLGNKLRSYRKELKALPQVWRQGHGRFTILYLSKLGSGTSLIG